MKTCLLFLVCCFSSVTLYSKTFGVQGVFVSATIVSIVDSESDHPLHSDTSGVFLNIRYHGISGVNPDLLSLDIYKPMSAKGKKPVMIYVHGGYWNAGDKYSVADKPKLFNDSGYVFVSVNYRLSPDPPDTSKTDRIKFPDHPRDIAKAIKWLYDNIRDYDGDKERLFLIGHSAGAHLVLLTSTNDSFLKEVGLPLNSIKGTCSLDCGVFDVFEELKQANNLPVRSIPIINAFGNDSSLWDDASPQYQIKKGKVYPPILLVHQNVNDRVYSNLRFIDSMKANGNTTTINFNANPYDHGQIAGMLGNPNDYNGETRTVMGFFKKILSTPASVEESNASAVPGNFMLHQNYPNPFNPSTVISFHIPTAGHITLKVYDVLGREAATLVDETRDAGFHQSLFSTREHPLASGVYFYRLSAGSYAETKQMLVMK